MSAPPRATPQADPARRRAFRFDFSVSTSLGIGTDDALIDGGSNDCWTLLDDAIMVIQSLQSRCMAMEAERTNIDRVQAHALLDARRRLDRRDEEIAALRDQLGAARVAVSAQSAALADARDTVVRQEGVVAALRKGMAELEAESRAASMAIDRLRSEAVSNVTSRIAVRDGEISALEPDIATRRDTRHAASVSGQPELSDMPAACDTPGDDGVDLETQRIASKLERDRDVLRFRNRLSIVAAA